MKAILGLKQSPLTVTSQNSRRSKVRMTALGRDRRIGATSAPEKVSRSYDSPTSRQQQKGHDSAWTVAEFQKLFRNYDMEEEYHVTDIEGMIPQDLEGTFYRNGPGILELGGEQMHCFDGHGLMAKISFQNGKAHFRSRYIQTEPYRKETQANKILYRGFGSMKPGGVLNNFMDFTDKPVANTSVLEWGGKLYALWEANNPFILDPATLETLGEETFGGTLREAQPFTAHPCYDRFTDRLVAFSNGIRHGEGKLHVWEINRDGKILQSISHTVGMLPVLYLHDFQVTKNWYIFHQAPLALIPTNLVRYFAGLCDQTQQIRFDESSPGKWWLVPRDGGAPQIVETDPCMIWHYGNAFEDDKTGKVFVDACRMKSFNFSNFNMRDPTTIPGGEVCRFEIDPELKTSHETPIMPGLASGDFPQHNPAYQGDINYKYLYVAGTADETETFPFRRVVKLNMQEKTRDSWLAPPGCFVGEPIYIPRKAPQAHAGEGKVGNRPTDEDDGYVACLISDGRRERSSIEIFEARRLSEGPICSIHLRNLLPMAFHCSWSETAFI